MACIDGVLLGNSFTNILGINMSKDWKEPDQLTNPTLAELKKYLKKLETKRQCQIFFFLDLDTIFTRPHGNIESNDYQIEDAFDRFLKIRFFPNLMCKLAPQAFIKALNVYHPKLKNFEYSIVTIKNEFSTFLAYKLNFNSVLSRMQKATVFNIEEIFEDMCLAIMKGLYSIMIVFVDKTKANFNEVKRIKNEKKNLISILSKNDFKEYQSFIELSKRLKIPINNMFIDMQKQFLFHQDEVEESGLQGEILHLIKTTFEDIANFAVTSQRSYINQDIMNLTGIVEESNKNKYEEDIEEECKSPEVPRIRDVKKVGFLLDNLNDCEQIYKGKEYEVEDLTEKKYNQNPRKWREMNNSMLNISYEQKKEWQYKNATSVLISKNGSLSKFTSPRFSLKHYNHNVFHKLTDVANGTSTPFLRSPSEKVHKYIKLLRSSYLNENFFHRYVERVNVKKQQMEKEERSKINWSLVNKLPPLKSP